MRILRSFLLLLILAILGGVVVGLYIPLMVWLTK